MMSLVIVMSLVGQTPEAKKTEQAIPDDFKIVAEYSAGYSIWHPWTATITADGKVEQKIFDYPKSSEKKSKLSKDDMNDLQAMIKEAEFSGLKASYGAFGVTDQESMTLKITADKKTHRVYLYGYSLHKDNKDTKDKDKDDMERFVKVWREVLKKVPSPNADQRPEEFNRSPEAEKTKEAIPADFAIVAHYDPGHSDLMLWTGTITADGKVTHEVRGRPEIKLSAEDMNDLLTVIKETKFSELPLMPVPHTGFGADLMCLTVTADGKKHEVFVYNYSEVKDGKAKAELKRFAKVWREILKRVPTPNPSQTPENFDR
jgi:hypothetical protein